MTEFTVNYKYSIQHLTVVMSDVVVSAPGNNWITIFTHVV